MRPPRSRARNARAMACNADAMRFPVQQNARLTAGVMADLAT